MRSATRKHGFTLLETLVAVTIVSFFMAGMVAAFIQVLNASTRAETILTAVANGRSALDTIGVDIKQANYFRRTFYFRGQNETQSYGDGIDNDGDGQIDEEFANGLDEDGDYSDLHAEIGAGGLKERPDWVGVADLGDLGVDEDVLFDRDTISFRIYPDPSDPDAVEKEIAFSLGEYEGKSNVLLKSVTLPGSSDPEEISPLAFGVLSFNALYWQPNGSINYWEEEWDSAGASALARPRLRLPAAVALTLHMHADTTPTATYVAGQPVETVVVSTVVNIEQVINDRRYPRD